MAKAIQKIAMNAAENIPYDKLVLSQKNVRRVKDGVSIEQLAEDIGRRMLLQSLNVRPVLGEDGEETGTFEVPAGGRRYLALGMLIKQKRLAKNEPIPCIVNRSAATSAEEELSGRELPPRGSSSSRPVSGVQDTKRPGPRSRRDRRALLRLAGDGEAAPAARLGFAKTSRSLRKG